MIRTMIAAGFVVLSSVAVLPVAEAAPPVVKPVDFAHEVLPILHSKCGRCHTTPQHKGGFSIDTREKLLKGGDTGPGAVPGKSSESLIIKLVTTADEDERMPSNGKPLTAEQIDVLRRWVDAGLPWDAGVVLGTHHPEAKMEPRAVTPPPTGPSGSNHPIDRILEAQSAKLAERRVVSDRVFIRRATLDLIGLLPTPEEIAAFEADPRTEKRGALITRLLEDRRNYTEHWITFWNDALRNAYRGTGFIDGGRSQITAWLYRSLHENKPYDQFVRELVTAAPGAEGFTKGIVWRGVVNASQKPEMQAAQNVGQLFMGTNLKCASCHDSFVNNWKLADAYALAAAFADGEVEMHHCDKPTGEMAKAGFLYPRLGGIDPAAPKKQRMEQVAALLTHEKNGRLARTMVNRLWAMLMGRGIVEPVDDMDQTPFSGDLLDYLAHDFATHEYDIKRTLHLICTSRAYGLEAVGMSEPSEHDFVFAGPVVKRMTAEQFSDALSMLTGVWRPAGAGSIATDGRAQGGQLAAIAPVLGVPVIVEEKLNPRKQKQTVTRVDAKAIGRVRASMSENDALMAALGRPHREQVVTRRESIATTLQALEMTNGKTLDDILRQGAANWMKRGGGNDVIEQVYLTALGRAPTPAERAAAKELLGESVTTEGIADLMWSVVMLPEFQLVY